MKLKANAAASGPGNTLHEVRQREAMRTCEQPGRDDALVPQAGAKSGWLRVSGWRGGALFAAFCTLALVPSGASPGGPTFRIAGVVYSGANAGPSAFVPAGVNGAALTLSGTVPGATQQASVGVCFYTGAASGTPTALTVADGTADQVTVPAAVVRGIPQSAFTAANGYAVTAQVYFAPLTAQCDGTFDATLTNEFPVRVVAPSLGFYGGPMSVPQTNSSTGTQAAPLRLTLPAGGLLANNASGGNTTVVFGSFGSLPVVAGAGSLSVAVPAAFVSSPVGTTAQLSICNTFAGGAGSSSVCTTPATPITLSVVALRQSAGTITPAPSPVLASDQTILTAQFGPAAGSAPNPGAGAPSGVVSFAADGVTLPPAMLVLDTTATFSSQTSTITTPVAPTPVIQPVTGSYGGTQTVTISDSASAAAIYYTTDGSVPTSASTLYAGPFLIATTTTVQAIAVLAGSLNSAVAVSTITIRPATQLAFLVQPVTSQLNAAITPAVQVAIEDALGNVVTSSQAPVSVSLGSNQGGSTLAGTVTVAAVNGIATFADLSLNNVGTGYTLVAASTGLQRALSTAFDITPPTLTITPQSALIGIGSTLSGTVSVGKSAPQGGIVVSLLSSAPANVTISPATVTIAQGQTSATFSYTGVTAGAATLTASATNYVTGSAQVMGTAAQVSLGTIPPVAPGQMVSLALSLPTPAPPGGTTVTFTSSSPNIATVTSSIFVPAGLRTASTNPQITGILIGTTTITASAPGFAPDTRAVKVTVVAAFSPASTQISLGTSNLTTLTISAVAPAGGITFTLSSDDVTIATVPASVTIVQGGTSVPVPITGLKNGTTILRANSPGVTEATDNLTVNSTIVTSVQTTGVHLESPGYYTAYLPVAPSVPTTVTITVSDPTVAVISKSDTVAGSSTLLYTNVTAAGYVGTVYVQGLRQGSTTYTVSAPGYTNGTSAIDVALSGFSILGGDFSTTTFSPPVKVQLYASLLNANRATGTPLEISPGVGPISVPITSSNTATGTITTSPVIFNNGDLYKSTTLQPVAAGTTTLAIGATPTGFTTPVNAQQVVATVTAPQIVVQNVTTGVNVQTPSFYDVYLPVAPPSPVTVTVTSNGPGLALLSKSDKVAGTASLSFPNVTAAGYVGTIWVQGQKIGSTTYTASAPGYTSADGKIDVNPSGFVFAGNLDFTTTTFSAPTSLSLFVTFLNPKTLSYDTSNNAEVNPGVGPVNVDVTSSDSKIGTIATSPVVFNGGDSFKAASFQPVGAGKATVAIGAAPSGFSKASNLQQVVATVTAPAITVSNAITGKNLESGSPYAVFLPVAPPSAQAVTVTVNAPAVATLSKSDTVAGVTTLTFPNVTAAGYIGTIYVQGQTVGSTTFTASSPGYTSATGTIDVYPSGFTTGGTTTINTTTFSTPTTFNVFASALNPSTLAYNTNLEINPGVGPISVAVTSTNTSTGTISTSPVVFNAGDAYKPTTFQPLGAGTTNINLATPTGYSTASNYEQIVATVTAPTITVSDVISAVNLEATGQIYLPVAPPNPVTVTVTSNGPAITTIAKNLTDVGTTTLVFPNVTAAGYLPTIYVQGQSVGTTTLTASAPGYTNGTGKIAVYPSGFTYANVPAVQTTTFSAPTAVNVYASALNPGVLTYYTDLYLGPGVGTVSVPVTSSDTSVGTVTSPVVFHAGDIFQTTMFQPAGKGTTTLTLGVPQGFSTPSNDRQGTATVTAPAITVPATTTAVKLYNTTPAGYIAEAPPSATTFTAIIGDPSIAVVATSANAIGGASATFPNVTTAGYLPNIYIQGLAVGTTTLTVSAPGFATGTATITVDASGFSFDSTYSGGLSTKTTTAATALTVFAYALLPGSLNNAGFSLPVSPGGEPVSVSVTSSNPATGTITTSPLVFMPGTASLQTSFQPVAAGTTTLTVQVPPSFSMPTQYQQIAATVQ